MSSAKAKKKINFFKEIEESERRFKALGLSRPQDTYPEILRRARQINFGLIRCDDHPTSHIIQEWIPTDAMMESKKRWISIDQEFKPTWIKDTDDFRKMFDQLMKTDEFSIDVECHTHRTLCGYIALIQIGTNEEDYLIDPFGLYDEISTKLREQILESPNHLKVGHDLRNDNLWLQRDYGIFLAGCVDTQVLWNLYSGENMTSLLKLIQHFYPNSAQNKTTVQTISDWRLRPGMGMTWEQEQYAVVDVHLTLRIFDQLRYLVGEKSKELLKSAFHITKERLLKVCGELQSKCFQSDALKVLNKALCNPRSSGLVTKLKNDPSSLRKYLHLFEWRLLMSRILDDKEEFILPLKNVMQLSLLQEVTPDAIKDLCPGVHPKLWTRDSSRAMQAGVVAKIIQNEEFIQEIRDLDCHNCLQTGHGPAWSCPFPKNKENNKMWMNRPENKQVKDKQNLRRFNNLAAKVGEKKAQAAVSSNK